MEPQFKCAHRLADCLLRYAPVVTARKFGTCTPAKLSDPLYVLRLPVRLNERVRPLFQIASIPFEPLPTQSLNMRGG